MIVLLGYIIRQPQAHPWRPPATYAIWSSEPYFLCRVPEEKKLGSKDPTRP